MTAVLERDAELLSKLLKHGDDANSGWPDGLSALHISAHGGDTETGELLLDHGAVPDNSDNLGNTPLMYAAAQNHDKFIQLLMFKFKKLNVNTVNKQGDTALHLAAKKGHTEALRSLLSKVHLIDTDIKNIDGFRAIDLAFIENRFSAQEVLAMHNPRRSMGEVNIKAALKLSQTVGNN